MMMEDGYPLPSTLIQADGLPATFEMDLSDMSESSLSPTYSDFPELTPYSTASSFNLPKSCDASLLTPTSTAPSPSLAHMTKLGFQYTRSPTTPYFHQQLSPPVSSRLFPPWNNPFEVNAPESQVDSPMPHSATLASDIFSEQYMKEYNLSSGGMNSSAYTNLSAGTAKAAAKAPSKPLQLRCGPIITKKPTKFVSQQAQPRTPSVAEKALSPRSNGVKKSKKQKPKTVRYQNVEYDLADTFKNCHGDEVPPRLKIDCPDELRCIFQSRWKHREKRGQHMWDAIQEDIAEELGKTIGKETLQMKFKRGRSKYYHWLDKDVEILRKAWVETERDRYKIILDRFHHLGGSRNMLLCPSDVEFKLATELKYEEGFYVDNFADEPVRRRRKLNVKRNDVPAIDDSDTPDVDEDEVIDDICGKDGGLDDEIVPTDDEDEEDDGDDGIEGESAETIMADENSAATKMPEIKSPVHLGHPSETKSTLYQRRRG